MQKSSTTCKISAIVPVFNVENYLGQCLDSISRQTLKDFEVIIVNDGSDDSSPKICDNYAKRDCRIKVFHRDNGGYASACNLALENCSGDYIALVEPDAFIDERMFEDLYVAAKNFNADIVKSAFWELTDTARRRSEKLRSLTIKETETFDIGKHPEIFARHPSIWSCIYKRKFLQDNKINFKPEKIRGWEDNLFQVATMCAAKRIFYIDKAYYHWRKTYLLDYEKISTPQMPILRSIEICAFLKSKNISNPDILACLLRRSLVYLKLSFEAASLKNLSSILQLTRRWYAAAQIPKASRSKFFKNSLRLFAAGKFPPFLCAFFKIKLLVKKFSATLKLR